jgi:hypothetical protein
MSNRFKKLLVNKEGSAIFLVVLLLAGVLTISLGAADLIVSGAKMGKVQYDSTKAYFASEAGAEKLLYDVRRNIDLFEPENELACDTSNNSINVYVDFYTTPASCQQNILNCTNLDCKDVLSSNNSSFYVEYYSFDNLSTTPIKFKSFGSFRDTKRSVEVTFDRPVNP